MNKIEELKKDIITALDTFQTYPTIEQLKQWLKAAQEGK